MRCSLLEKFLKTKEFIHVFKNCEIKDELDAVASPFFMGVHKEYSGVVVTEEKPAFTEKDILERMKDKRFCLLCLQFQNHAVDCKNNPLNV